MLCLITHCMVCYFILCIFWLQEEDWTFFLLMYDLAGQWLNKLGLLVSTVAVTNVEECLVLDWMTPVYQIVSQVQYVYVCVCVWWTWQRGWHAWHVCTKPPVACQYSHNLHTCQYTVQYPVPVDIPVCPWHPTVLHWPTENVNFYIHSVPLLVIDWFHG